MRVHRDHPTWIQAQHPFSPIRPGIIIVYTTRMLRRRFVSTNFIDRTFRFDHLMPRQFEINILFCHSIIPYCISFPLCVQTLNITCENAI